MFSTRSVSNDTEWLNIARLSFAFNNNLNAKDFGNFIEARLEARMNQQIQEADYILEKTTLEGRFPAGMIFQQVKEECLEIEYMNVDLRDELEGEKIYMLEQAFSLFLRRLVHDSSLKFSFIYISSEIDELTAKAITFVCKRNLYNFGVKEKDSTLSPSRCGSFDY